MLPRIQVTQVLVMPMSNHYGYNVTRSRVWSDGTVTVQILDHDGIWVSLNDTEVNLDDFLLHA